MSLEQYTLSIESSCETGNWAYVIRDPQGRRVLATGDRDLAISELKEATYRLNKDQERGTNED